MLSNKEGKKGGTARHKCNKILSVSGLAQVLFVEQGVLQFVILGREEQRSVSVSPSGLSTMSLPILRDCT